MQLTHEDDREDDGDYENPFGQFEEDGSEEDEPTEGDKPKVKLSGTDGNVFAIIGTMTRALKRAGQPEKAKEFLDKTKSAHSYDDVLQLCFEYADVE